MLRTAPLVKHLVELLRTISARVAHPVGSILRFWHSGGHSFSGGGCERRQTATVPIAHSPAVQQEPRQPTKVQSRILPRFRVFLTPVFCELGDHDDGRLTYDVGGRLRVPWKAVSSAATLGPTARLGARRRLHGRFHAHACIQRRRANRPHLRLRVNAADRPFLRSRFFFLLFCSAHRDCLFRQLMSMLPVVLTLSVL